MFRVRRPLLALIVLAALLVGGYATSALHGAGGGAAARSAATASDGRLPVVPVSSLPAEVGRTLTLVRRGGPFPYSRDGVVFDNREHHLPAHPSGYYHEYTVPTPGESDRGARRLVAGQAGEFYYTANHYVTFVAVDANR